MTSAYRAVTEQLLLHLSPLKTELTKLQQKLSSNSKPPPYSDFNLHSFKDNLTISTPTVKIVKTAQNKSFRNTSN